MRHICHNSVADLERPKSLLHLRFFGLCQLLNLLPDSLLFANSSMNCFRSVKLGPSVASLWSLNLARSSRAARLSAIFSPLLNLRVARGSAALQAKVYVCSVK